jgi:hypothetical protein
MLPFALSLALAACAGEAPRAAAPVPPAPKPKGLLTISLAHGSHREEATREQLERLLARYDLRPWLFTREVVIDDLAIPHSHPVLTLHTRHLGSDDQLLSTFLHEELHHFESAHREEVAAAMAALEKAFPSLPVGFPDGAGSLESSYLHLIVNHLEYESLVRVIGKPRADETFVFWEGDHYRTIYRTERLNRPAVRSIVARARVLPSFLAEAPESAPERFDLPPLESDPYPRAGRDEVDEATLSALLREAEQTRSTSLLVLHGKKLVAERTFGGPRDRLVQTMSVTKTLPRSPSGSCSPRRRSRHSTRQSRGTCPPSGCARRPKSPSATC